jgi:hypothetical protein
MKSAYLSPRLENQPWQSGGKRSPPESDSISAINKRSPGSKAAVGVGDAAMVGADDLAQILGIEARGQRRRAD